mmetsp:Transcript_62670/g.136096  ORF Transcript_62670/g.136096 Transcript_62670/m.136096 type:complete len:565 (-) Transcript_62670:121-1815(-)
MASSHFNSSSTQAVEQALAAFARGHYVVLVDSKSEGTQVSLALPAEHATGERIAFFIRNSTGIICAAVDQERLEGFGLFPDGGVAPGAHLSTDFIAAGTSLSAKDRAETLRALCDTSNPPSSFAKTGHTFLTCLAKGGISESLGRAEAASELCKLAGLVPVSVLADLMSEDGSIPSIAAASHFCERVGIPMLSVEQLIESKRGQKPSQSVTAHGPGPVMQTQSLIWIDEIEDDCMIRVYSTADPSIEIVAIMKGKLEDARNVPARVHSECFTGDIFASKRCDCGQQLHRFLHIMNTEPCGVMLYIKGHEGRGIGLPNKIRAYQLQDEGLDTVDANLKLGLPVDGRSYQDALAVFRDLGIKSVKLYTNNPDKVSALRPITSEVVALASVPGERNLAYLRTKRERLNHRTVLETFKLPTPTLDVNKTSIGVVYTTWNKYYVDELLRATEQELEQKGVQHTKLAVPGSCELISGARAIIRRSRPDAVVVLGVLIRGSSDLYEATCSAVMTGLTELNATQDTPIILGILMCRDEDQAHERSHGPINPAKAWAATAVHMASINQGARPS